MGIVVSSTHDLEGVEMYGVRVLGECILPIVHPGLPNVDLGDIPILICHSVVTIVSLTELVNQKRGRSSR